MRRPGAVKSFPVLYIINDMVIIMLIAVCLPAVFDKRR